MARIVRDADTGELKSLTQFYARADELCRQWSRGWESLLQEYRFLINSPIGAAEVSIHKWEALHSFSVTDCGFCILHREDDGLDCKNCEVFTTCHAARSKSIEEILDALETKLQGLFKEEEDEAQLSKEKK